MDLEIEFVGIKEIAGFLGLLWKTFARYLRERRVVAAREDCLGALGGFNSGPLSEP